MKILIYNLLLCLIMTSCGRIEYGPFPDVPFFSYEKDREYLFISKYDMLSFSVTDFSKSEAYSFKKNCDCDGGMSAFVKLLSKTNEYISINGMCQTDNQKDYFFHYNIIENNDLNCFEFYAKNIRIDTLIANESNPTYTWMKFSTEKGFYGFGNDTVQYMLK